VTVLAFKGADWELAWPRQLLLDEARWLLSLPSDQTWSQRAEMLLTEAFAGPAAVNAFRDTTPAHWSASRDLINRIVTSSPTELPEAPEPARYFSERNSGSEKPAATRDATLRRFGRLAADLYDRGYLEAECPRGCVDAEDRVDPAVVLEERLGKPGLWPVMPSQSEWADATFFDVVEVLHDLVARPRSRWWHDYSACGYHWSDFAREPAQVLYRWRVNRILAPSPFPFRLADGGEDKGRIVAAADTAREELVTAIETRVDQSTGDRVRHALALFRSRGTNVHDVRSAVVILAGVLEERREPVQRALTSKDEGALFTIANNFAIRHQDVRQQADYDQSFLHWIFWWYLATIELTDRLLERERS
jgi:hypothetical protein